MEMSMSDRSKDFLLNIFRNIPLSHLALFLHLLRLYPTNIVNESMKRKKVTMAVVNEVTNCDYEINVWS